MARSKKGFKHGRLLDVKSMLLGLKSLALRNSERTRRHQKERLGKTQAWKQEHLKSADDPGAEPSSEVSSRDLQIQTWYTEQLNEDLRHQIHEVREAEQEVENRRKVVEQSSMEKQSLEKLKEHQDREARLGTARDEQREMDEIAGRKRSSQGRPSRR